MTSPYTTQTFARIGDSIGLQKRFKVAKNSRSAENYYDDDLGNLDDVQNLVTQQFERLRVKGICKGFLVEE